MPQENEIEAEKPSLTKDFLPSDGASCSRSLFRAADIVHHAPSGEDWVLAVDEENGRVQPCGWPPTMADAKDCTLTTPATDAHRREMLLEWGHARHGNDHQGDSRTRTARRQISSENESSDARRAEARIQQGG
jgi:hypothetical protein